MPPWPEPRTEPPHVPFPALNPPGLAAAPAPRRGRGDALPFRPTAAGVDGVEPDGGFAFGPGADGSEPSSKPGVDPVVPDPMGPSALHLAAMGGDRPPAATSPYGLVATPVRLRRRHTDAPDLRRVIVAPMALAVVAPVAGALLGIGLAAMGDSLRVLGALCGVVGFLLGCTGAAVVLRRMHDRVEAPLLDLHRTLDRIEAGEIGARVDDAATSPLRPLFGQFNHVVDLSIAQLGALQRKAEWSDQSGMIFEALELVEDEPAAYRVMQDALALMEPDRRVELLMASRGQSRLHPTASNPSMPPPGCPVESTTGCVAIRRGQVVSWDSSHSINSCPSLRDRPGGPYAAACVPVTVAGQPIGVLHAVGPDREPLEAQFVDRLATVAAQLGNRVAALRALETSREEAGTDGLTGISNRRVVESRIETLLDSAVPFVMVIADLDSFKVLNDTYGHEAGDRALQLFAKVLQDNIRDHDIAGRVGGEEFVVVYPEMSVLRSIEAIERVRQALETSIARSAVQPFTCSFGVTHSSVGATVDEVLRVADAGLLRAKALGGDQVVYADESIAAEVFGTTTATPALGVRPY